jgi:hypothetical protein
MGVLLTIAVCRIWSQFFLPMRNRTLPGGHITDLQMRLYMRFRQSETSAFAAALGWVRHLQGGYRFERDPAAHPRNHHFAATLWRDGVILFHQVEFVALEY